MALATVATARPLIKADADTRIGYLKKVVLLTALGLGNSVFFGMLSAGLVAVIPFLQNSIVSLIVVLGSYLIANFAVRPLVYSGNSSKWIGFALGSTFQGIAMGYLLLAAVLMGASMLGNPFSLVFQALLLTGLTTLGMVAYVWTGPRDFSYLRAGLSMVFLPMMVLMAVSFATPFLMPGLFSGVIGIAITALFVVVSAAGLLYQVNQVMHKLKTDMHVEGAYMITMGILILFWNILVLLMKLQRR